MRNFYISILFLFLGISTSAQHAGDSFSAAKSSKKASLTYVYEGIDGFSKKNDKGEFEGLLVEVIRQFEQYALTKHGITITGQFVAVENDFEGYLRNVSDGNGGVFGISPASIKEERKSIMKFSSAYLNNISVLITHKSVATLVSMDNISEKFKSMKAYTVPGSTFADRVNQVKQDSFSSLKVTNVPSMYDMVDEVAGDQASFAFVDLNYYFDYLKQGSPLKRHPVGDLKGDEWGIIMPLDSDWKPILDDFLDSGFLQSSEYRQMIIDNLGKWALRMIE